jgi:predicted transcriptional regulator
MMINEYGIKQQQAAIFLGTTQAAISKYMKEDPQKYANVDIDNVALRKFIEKMKVDDEKGSQKILCVMCQNNKKFDCSFMVK